MKRKAVALLITLAFVTAIIGLVGVMASTFQNAFEETSKKSFITQSNVFFKDIKRILKDNVSDINGSQELDFLINFPIAVSDEENDISISITFASDSSKININKIMDANLSAKQEYLDSLDHALINYGVIDRAFFISLILDTIDEDTQERIFESEISLKSRFFKNGKIENFNHFQKIIDYYKRHREDPAIDLVPWSQIVGFENEKIDFNYITEDALWFILRRYDKSFLKEVTTQKIEVYESFDELFFNEEDKTLLEAFGVEFFAPQILCKAFLKQGDQEGDLRFSYNLNTKEVSNVEFSY